MQSGSRQPDGVFDFDGEYGTRYEKLAHQLIPAYAQLFPAALALLEGHISREAAVLVVGCGTGVELATFGSAQPSWRLTGVDPSEQMIDLARRKLELEGFADGCTLVHGYVDDLSREATFDAATLFNVMHFLPDDGGKLALLESISTRLVSGGRLVMVDLHGETGTPEFDRLMSAWRAYMILRGLTRAEREVFLDRLERGMHYVSEHRILDLLAQAGFGEITQFYRAFLYGGWIARRS